VRGAVVGETSVSGARHTVSAAGFGAVDASTSGRPIGSFGLLVQLGAIRPPG
jgi:hypothetical protein